MSHVLKRVALALLLFLLVYAPAFALVAWLHPSVELTIPLIVAISACIAAICLAMLAKPPQGAREFGLARSRLSFIFAAAIAGVIIGLAFAYIAARYPAPSPLDLSKLPPWMIIVYFVIAAPIQEELIFRGLLQTLVSRGASSQSFWTIHFPVFFIAALFGIIHLDSGVIVAAEAILLGLIAGELRRISGSLIPAILFHALLNAASALWPSA
jgi:membrane protease YdiL (CAAX protease family)